ncbi:MAG: solute symporter family protein [Pseudonocardia sp.]
MLLAQAGVEEIGSPAVNITIFGVFVVLTLVVVFRAGRSNRTAADYYTAGQAFTGPQNGVALAGDYLSAASFLGVAGAIALFGYDGFLFSVGALVAWLVALLLVAELMRNTGKFTMGDVLAFRMRQRPVRAAAAVSTLVVSVIYMLTQLVGAGGLIALLLHIPNSNRLGQSLVIAAAGGIMILYVLVGGMKGTTWVQIIKAVLLLFGTSVLAAWVIGRYGFNFSAMLADAVANSPKAGEKLLAPGLQYGASTITKIDFISLALALVLGTAALPHILMRFYTVPNSREARRSVQWAIWLIGIFYLMLIVVGYGAVALVGADAIAAAPGSSNSAAPLLAFKLGGELMLGLISAVAFATILAVVAGLTITASASFAHDVYANIIKKGKASPDAEVRVARLTAVGIGVAGVLGAIAANGQNVAVLVVLAFAVAASANLPTILFSLFWKRFNTTGALFSIYGGIVSCLALIVLGPGVSGTPRSMIPDADFAIFPLANPGLVSIPLSFLLGVIGTFIGGRDDDGARRFAEMEVRSLTGGGAPPRRPAGGSAPARRPRPVTQQYAERRAAAQFVENRGQQIDPRRGIPVVRPPGPAGDPRYGPPRPGEGMRGGGGRPAPQR